MTILETSKRQFEIAITDQRGGLRLFNKPLSLKDIEDSSGEPDYEWAHAIMDDID